MKWYGTMMCVLISISKFLEHVTYVAEQMGCRLHLIIICGAMLWSIWGAINEKVFVNKISERSELESYEYTSIELCGIRIFQHQNKKT
ncbi:Uncharacterized protein TCM_041256 [Theobroma cacao]|uniref:Uncharacterized protein n=1 Tax=Theobroma cacao TaxID=3641 RepID=A0A061GUY8_THECC|nr:Uncharacterized protein TCM_041256 [Theobroma cacao]